MREATAFSINIYLEATENCPKIYYLVLVPEYDAATLTADLLVNFYMVPSASRKAEGNFPYFAAGSGSPLLFPLYKAFGSGVNTLCLLLEDADGLRGYVSCVPFQAEPEERRRRRQLLQQATEQLLHVRIYTMMSSAALCANASASIVAAVAGEQFRTQYNQVAPVRDMLQTKAVLSAAPMVRLPTPGEVSGLAATCAHAQPNRTTQPASVGQLHLLPLPCPCRWRQW